MDLASCCLWAATLDPYSSEDDQSEFLSSLAASESLLSCWSVITFPVPLCLGASNWNIKSKGNGSLSVVISSTELVWLYGALCSSLISGSGWSGPLLWAISWSLKHHNATNTPSTQRGNTVTMKPNIKTPSETAFREVLFMFDICLWFCFHVGLEKKSVPQSRK